MAQENSDNMQVVMGIIMQAGNAKAAAMQATLTRLMNLLSKQMKA